MRSSRGGRSPLSPRSCRLPRLPRPLRLRPKRSRRGSRTVSPFAFVALPSDSVGASTPSTSSDPPRVVTSSRELPSDSCDCWPSRLRARPRPRPRPLSRLRSRSPRCGRSVDVVSRASTLSESSTGSSARPRSWLSLSEKFSSPASAL